MRAAERRLVPLSYATIVLHVTQPLGCLLDWSPDQVQTVIRQQEGCAGFGIRKFLADLLHRTNKSRFLRVRRIDDLIVLRRRYTCISNCTGLGGNCESFSAQEHSRALRRQPLHPLEGGSVSLAQVQHRIYLALPEVNQFFPLSKFGNEVERSTGVQLYRALACDMGRIRDVEDDQPPTPVLLDIKKRFAVD